jgi:hypothetical protein
VSEKLGASFRFYVRHCGEFDETLMAEDAPSGVSPDDWAKFVAVRERAWDQGGQVLVRCRERLRQQLGDGVYPGPWGKSNWQGHRNQWDAYTSVALGSAKGRGRPKAAGYFGVAIWRDVGMRGVFLVCYACARENEPEVTERARTSLAGQGLLPAKTTQLEGEPNVIVLDVVQLGEQSEVEELVGRTGAVFARIGGKVAAELIEARSLESD